MYSQKSISNEYCSVATEAREILRLAQRLDELIKKNLYSLEQLLAEVEVPIKNVHQRAEAVVKLLKEQGKENHIAEADVNNACKILFVHLEKWAKIKASKEKPPLSPRQTHKNNIYSPQSPRNQTSRKGIALEESEESSELDDGDYVSFSYKG